MPLLNGGTPSCRRQPTSPGSTISSVQFLWLHATPCSYMPAPVPLLPSFQIVKLYGEQWPKPTGEMWRKIADDFYSMWQFPNCIGAIYKKHFEIQDP
jgi:hypothetical protein